jgi:hypothetical protein
MPKLGSDLESLVPPVLANGQPHLFGFGHRTTSVSRIPEHSLAVSLYVSILKFPIQFYHP